MGPSLSRTALSRRRPEEEDDEEEEETGDTGYR